MHGMSLNVSTDLSLYSHIVPCGMPGLDVTSMERETGQQVSVERVGREWAELFADVLFLDVEWRPASQFPEFQSAHVPVSV